MSFIKKALQNEIGFRNESGLLTKEEFAQKLWHELKRNFPDKTVTSLNKSNMVSSPKDYGRWNLSFTYDEIFYELDGFLTPKMEENIISLLQILLLEEEKSDD